MILKFKIWSKGQLAIPGCGHVSYSWSEAGIQAVKHSWPPPGSNLIPAVEKCGCHVNFSADINVTALWWCSNR
jgi:hypothetical protein